MKCLQLSTIKSNSFKFLFIKQTFYQISVVIISLYSSMVITSSSPNNEPNTANGYPNNVIDIPTRANGSINTTHRKTMEALTVFI